MVALGLRDGGEVMSRTIRARTLLAEGARAFDHAGGGRLAVDARQAWRAGFASGGAWMIGALSALRDEADSDVFARLGPADRRWLNVLGVFKNGGSALLAAAVATAGGALLARTTSPGLAAVGALVVFVTAFYAIEGQMVFLFPMMLDPRGEVPPRTLPEAVRRCRAWTVRAGGTLAVMRIVMPISASMVFGGFVGRGFVRSWCIGCIAVVRWYDQLP